VVFGASVGARLTNQKPKLAALYLDGTLLRGDTVWEALARPLGRLDRVQQFEKLRSSDFDGVRAAREEVAAWLSGLAAGLGTPMDRVAAVGDSGGDLDMLQAVGHPYWVGHDLPAGLSASHHPDGDIERIAQDIVAALGE